MTDNSNDDRGRPRKPGGGKAPRFEGPRKPRPTGGDFRRDERPRPAGGEAPLRRRSETGWTPLGTETEARAPLADGDIVRPPRRDGERKPFRPKPRDGERSFKPHDGGDRRPRPERIPRPERKPKGPPSTQRTVERAEGEERIAKVMARAGLCSRREAEAWIEAGRVEVNGETISSPALNVGRGDQIRVDGKALPGRERTRLWLFHKPRGLVTTQSDPEGRATIFGALPDALPRVVSIGRLDINTEGLLLLTNDGGLSRMLELPATGWLRRYRVRAHGDADQGKLDALREGVSIDGVDYAGIEAHLDRQQGSNVWLTMGLREGKNREIKKVLEHIGLGVNRLIRISFGPFQLGELAEGAVEEIKTRILVDQLGPQLIADAGADFEAPLIDRTQKAEPEAPAAPRAPRPRPPHREDRAAEPPAERRPERPQGGKRKHISIIRAEQRQAEAGARKRVERAETADRKGRAVKVERVVPVREKPRGAADNRNARRFRNERDETRAPHSKPRLETRPPTQRDARRPFRDRSAGDDSAPRRSPRPDGEQRAFRKPRAEGEQRPFRKPRDDNERPRAPRRDFEKPRPPRADAERPRKPRADGEQRPFRKPRDDNERPRAPRREFDKTRPPRADGERAFRRDDKPSGGRPPRRDAPAGERPFRGKPSGGRPGGKPRGPRPPRRDA